MIEDRYKIPVYISDVLDPNTGDFDGVKIMVDYASLMSPPTDVPLQSARKSAGKIHVGFISRFFKDHTIGRLNQGLIDRLNAEFAW